MYIAKLKLKNFQCYAEEQTIELKPSVYAIVAKHTGDAERSNWLGKTTLLEAIRFALYGHHRHETDDEWITHGAVLGEVAIELDDGTLIERKRERGKSTRLWYWPGNERSKGAMQTEAQNLILQHVGLTQKDFLATCYFPQKVMSQFVTQSAGDRMETVVQWLQLEPLEQCEADLRAAIAVKLDAQSKLAENLRSNEQNVTTMLARYSTESFDYLKSCVAPTEAQVEIRRGTVALCQRKLMSNEAIRSGIAKHAEYETVVRVGKELAAKFDEKGGAALKKSLVQWREYLDKLSLAKATAERELRTKLTVARGEFDGACPVAGIACPAKDQINTLTKAAKEAALVAEAAVDELRGKHAEAARTVQKASDDYAEWTKAEGQLQELRRQVVQLDAAKTRPTEELQPHELLVHEFNTAMTSLATAQAEVMGLLQAIKSIEQAIKAIDAVKVELARMDGELTTLREAMLIFGKNGAQRRIAEGVLKHIEASANELLGDSGIELQVGIHWSRTGQGFAAACESCGNPFPSSVKVKTCMRCGAERGPKLVNKLDIALSNSSGAADDLAGGAVQLAASSWLRRERGALWNVAMLDEPFGALDAANRRAFAAHLTAMLRGAHGFEQAFVIAHHASVLDALPSRIEITSDGKRATMRTA